MTLSSPHALSGRGLRRMNMVLDWVANVQFAGPCWALANGLYRAAGIDMAVQPWVDDGRSIIEKALACDVPVLASSEDNLVIGAAAHDKSSVAALAVMFQTTPLVLMSPPDAPLRNVTDLRAKRIAIHCDGLHVLKGLLALHGIERSDVDIVEVTNDLDNLTSGRFDAVQGYALCEPLEHRARGLDPALLRLRHRDLHPYAQVLFAPVQDITREPDLYRAALEATFAGWRAAMEDPVGAVEAIAKVGAPMADKDQEIQALKMAGLLVRGEGRDGQAGIGRIDPARWAANVRSYARAGHVSKDTSATCGLRLDIWGPCDKGEAL